MRNSIGKILLVIYFCGVSTLWSVGPAGSEEGVVEAFLELYGNIWERFLFQGLLLKVFCVFLHEHGHLCESCCGDQFLLQKQLVRLESRYKS
jgi:hypothetical protein